jgi:hypothetical protein
MQCQAVALSWSEKVRPLRGSNHGARRSQKRIISPPKITAPVGERIRYLPKPVGPWADPTLAPRRYSLTRKVNA